MIKFGTASVCLLVLISMEINAQGPPVFSDTPILLGLEGRGVRTFGKYISKKNGDIYIQPIAIPVNITPKLAVGAIIPFVSKSIKGKSTQSGVGDMAVFLKYVVLQKDYPGKTFRSMLKITEIFPTGRTSSDPPIGIDASQTHFALVTGYITTKYGIYTEVGYNIVSNHNDDVLVYNMAFSYPLLPQKYPPKQVNLSVDFNGNYISKSKINTLFISPGVQFIPGRKILLESGIQLPIVEEVPQSQKTNFMLLLGTRILIF